MLALRKLNRPDCIFEITNDRDTGMTVGRDIEEILG